ncbi:MAG: ATP-binding protein [Lachnospiraceae bacterium]
MKADIKLFFNKLISRIRLAKSLRFWIFCIVIVVGYVPTLIMRFGILQNYEERAVSLRTMEVENQTMILANHLAANNYLQDTSSETINAELLQFSNLYDGRVLVIDQNFNVIKDTYGISEGKTIISEEVIRCFKGKNISNYDSTNQYIEMTMPITVSTEDSDKGIEDAQDMQEADSRIMGVMLVSVSTDNITTNIEVLDGKASILQFLIMILIVVLSWFISKMLVKPFERVTASISAVRDGYETEAADVPDYLETEHIIATFNELLKRMKVLDESRQEFVSNVSHELKTPITSMKVLADSLISQEDVPVELYKEFMTDIADEIDRENKIINDLLSLVKMDKTAADLNIESISINELIELILKRLKPIAGQKDIDVIYQSVREVTAEVDEVKLTLAISNLVENAIKYNKEHGYVKVTLDADHQFFTIVVEDNGIGIPEESKEHIFERFYRVDKSHSRKIGGTGLGLAISRNAILMHRGAIGVESEEGVGTAFYVKIPLTYVSK